MSSKKIRLSCSVVGSAEADAVSRIVLEDGYLGMGKEVKAFEEEIAAFLDVPTGCVICLNSGTAAIHLATQAVTKPGDEVLVQSLTFIASFQAITASSAIPIACEVYPDTITLDLNDADKRLTEKTKVVMPVHYASYTGDLDSIYDFAAKNNLRVIEDASHAFGCLYKGGKIGSFGDIVCFSFDGIKNITSGEGGAVVTRDRYMAQKIRDMRLLGIEKDTDKRYADERSWEFEVKFQGYRYHMSNILAAIGRVQLKRFMSEFAPKRSFLAKLYRKELHEVTGIDFLKTDPDSVIPHIQPILVGGGKRNDLRQFLEHNGIGTGIHYKPNHLLEYYGNGKCKLPITEKLYTELLSLPLHPKMSVEDVGYVTDKIKEFFSN